MSYDYASIFLPMEISSIIQELPTRPPNCSAMFLETTKRRSVWCEGWPVFRSVCLRRWRSPWKLRHERAGQVRPAFLTMAKPNSAWNSTRVSKQLGIEYPIIQGPLGGFSSQRLTAAVSNFGGLGSFGAHSLAPSAIEEVIAEIRSLTNKPFAMNLWVSMEDEGATSSSAKDFEHALPHLTPHLEAVGADKPQFSPYKPIRFEDQAAVLLDA